MKSPKKRKKDIVVTYQYVEPKTEAERIAAERNLEAVYDIIMFDVAIPKMEKELEGDTSMIPEKTLRMYKKFVYLKQLRDNKRRRQILM